MRTNHSGEQYWKENKIEEVMFSFMKDGILERISKNWKSELRKGYLSTDTKYVKYKETFPDFCIRFFKERMIGKEFKHKQLIPIISAFIYICGVIYYNQGPKSIWFTRYESIYTSDGQYNFLRRETVTKNTKYLLKELGITHKCFHNE